MAVPVFSDNSYFIPPPKKPRCFKHSPLFDSLLAEGVPMEPRVQAKGWRTCMLACQLACLFDCSRAYLLAYLLVCLFVCLLVCLLACLLACLFDCLFACKRSQHASKMTCKIREEVGSKFEKLATQLAKMFDLPET